MQAAAPPSSASSSALDQEHIYYASLLLPARAVASSRRGGWLPACYRLTARVERVSSGSALLDLGACTGHEALAALKTLITTLHQNGFGVRAGIGPSLALAQLAASAAAPLRIVTPEEAPLMLRNMPVSVLANLHPQGTVTSEMLDRLQLYGLRTLGHVARLSEHALRRQFGAAGAFLAAVARGDDVRPLQPTPRPLRQRSRFRFTTPASPERVAAALPHLSRRIAAHLRRRGRKTGSIRVSLHWENGGIQRARLVLRQRTCEARLIEHELRRLVLPLLHERGQSGSLGVDEVRVILGNFAPAYPEQATFWRMREQQLTLAREIAETLAQRHARALLLSPALAVPDAIFPEDRYQLVALGPERRPEHSSRATQTARPHLRQADTAGDIWQQVPQRLHWW